jgi:hypothetical protein
MPRKLKTYVAALGFFELAVAVPSKKAAMVRWGVEKDPFRSGVAKETTDPKIVAATEEQPGVVLRRPIGSKGPFKTKGELPVVNGRPAEKARKPKSDQFALRRAAAMEKAEARHQEILDGIANEREKLERRQEAEDQRWQSESTRLDGRKTRANPRGR